MSAEKEMMQGLRWDVRAAFTDHAVLTEHNGAALDAAVSKILEQIIDSVAVLVTISPDYLQALADIDAILREMKTIYDGYPIDARNL